MVERVSEDHPLREIKRRCDRILASDDRYIIEVDILSDLNADDRIDAADLSKFDLLASVGSSRADLNRDGFINNLDRGLIESTLGLVSTRTVPAPTTAALAALTLGAISRRRRSAA